MTDKFHRLTTPAYFVASGDFPADADVAYDYINDPAANGDGGVPSGVNSGKHLAGANEGSYFTGFQDEATSANSNRAHEALAENDEHIDNLLHRDLAAIAKSNVATAGGGGVSSIGLTSNLGVFIGDGAQTLDDLFRIVDQNGNDVIVNATGLQCKVTAMSGATINTGTGYTQSALTLTVAPAIPSGQQYRLVYRKRSNAATLDTKALRLVTLEKNIDARVLQSLRDINGTSIIGAQYAWDDTPPSSLGQLAAGGIHDRYMRNEYATTGRPETWYDTLLGAFGGAGSGGYFSRSGPAMVGYTGIGDIDGDEHKYTDPINAIWKSVFWSSGSVGDTGFVNIGARRLTNLADEGDWTMPGFASFLSVFTTPTAASADTELAALYTRITYDAPCTLTVVGGELVVTLTGTYDRFWKTGDVKSSIACGYDMLEVRADWTVHIEDRPVTFVITSLDSTNNKKATLRLLSGAPADTFPGFAGTITGVVRLLRAQFGVGDGGPELYDALNPGNLQPVLLRGLFYATGNDASLTGADNLLAFPAQFFSSRGAYPAMQWGAHSNSAAGNQTATYVANGALLGDGSMEGAGHILMTGNVGSSTTMTSPLATFDKAVFPPLEATVATTGSFALALSTQILAHRKVWVSFTAASAVTLTDIDLGIDGLSLGFEFDLYLVCTHASGALQVDDPETAWDVDCVFEGAGDRVLSATPNVIDHYHGHVVKDWDGNKKALMSVRRYG